MGLFSKSPEDNYQAGLLALEQGDMGTALKKFEAAAKRGHRASSIFVKALTERDPESMYRCGELYHKMGKEETARAWYKQAAEKGYPDAQFRYADYLFQYQSDSKKALAEALMLAEKLYGQGWDVGAELCIQILLITKPYDAQKALMWAERAYRADIEYMCVSLYQTALERWIAQEKPSAEKLYEAGAAAYKSGDIFKAYFLLKDLDLEENADAACLFGLLLEKGGLGVDADPEEAKKYLLQAAENGSIEAQTRCLALAREGEGKDFDEASLHKWLQGAGERGDAEARAHCIELVRTGRSQGFDRKILRQWQDAAAKKGGADAQYEYAEHLGWFDGGEKWYVLAAEQGHAGAQYRCALQYSVAADVEKARYWLKKLEATGRHEEAGHILKELDRALKRKAADTAYQEGDYTKALALYDEVFRGDDPELLDRMVAMCLNGWGTAPDPARAVRYYEEAVSIGDYHAALALAKLYDEGRVIEQDWEKASKLYAEGVKIGFDSCADELREEMVRCAELAKFGFGDGFTGQMLAMDCMHKAAYGVYHRHAEDFWPMDGTEPPELMRLKVGLNSYNNGGSDDFTISMLKQGAEKYVLPYLPLVVLLADKDPKLAERYFREWLFSIEPGSSAVLGSFPQRKLFNRHTASWEPVWWTVLDTDILRSEALLLCNDGLLYEDDIFFGHSVIYATVADIFSDGEKFLVAEQRYLTREEFERYIVQEKAASAEVSATTYATTRAAQEVGLYVEEKADSIELSTVSETDADSQRAKAFLSTLCDRETNPWWLAGGLYVEDGEVHGEGELAGRDYRDRDATRTAVIRPAIKLKWQTPPAPETVS